MSLLSLHRVGTLQRREVLSRPFPSCATYVELIAGAYLVASVNVARNVCTVELLLDRPAIADTTNAKSSILAPLETSTENDKTLEALRVIFQMPRVFELLDEEGLITAFELVRDHRRVEGTKELSFGSRKLLKSLYVHLFIGTSNGTVFVCNALHGTIMALAQFHYHGKFSHDRLEHAQGDGEDPVSLNETVVRFAAHRAGPDARFNANVAQSIAVLPTEVLHAVCVVHSKGRVILLNREVLDVFLFVAEQHLDGSRPYLMLEWSPNSTISVFPTAGPAAHFASYVKSVFVLKEVERYSAVELQTQLPTSNDLMKRNISDAAFFFSNKGDTMAVLRSGPQATGSLLLCGEMPALSIYTFEDTQAEFSARQAVKAVMSVLGGMARKVWWGSPSSEDVVDKPKPLSRKLQLAKDVFLEADMAFNTVQVDPTSQWAACYSEGAGRIYIYDLMGGAVWRVMKGCRSAEFQWYVTTIAGKRMLLLVVHLLLRQAVEVYSLRLGRRVAARHVPQGSILLRPETASSVLLLTPSGCVLRITVELNKKREEDGSMPSLGMSSIFLGEGLPSAAFLQEKGYQMMPRDILMVALRLPLPVQITDEELFTKYYLQMKKLENGVKNNFSPGVSDDRCLPMNTVITADDVPNNITAAQCLNYLELRLACVANYRRALLLQVPSEEALRPQTKVAGLFNNEALFIKEGQPHPSVGQAFRAALKMLVAEGMPDISALVEDILPSLQKLLLLQERGGIDVLDNPCPDISPIPLNVFLGFFFFGGYKLVFLREAVQVYETAADGAVDVWAEIGAVFYGGVGRGPRCLMQQLEVFSALGFQAVDVALFSLSWMCHSFARSPSYVSLGSLSNLVFLLKTCNDAAFLSGVEQVSCLITDTLTSYERSEACQLLLILCMVIRQGEKPVGEAHYGRYLRLLQQLLVLRTMLYRCREFLQGPTSLSSRGSGQKLCLGKLLPYEGGEALSLYYFRFFSPSVAQVLCENIMEYEELKRSLGGVDLIKLVKLLSFRENSLDWTVETPWYKDGAWSHGEFSLTVSRPLWDMASANTLETVKQELWNSIATPQQLAGFSVLLVVELILLQWILEPLREEPLTFLHNNVAPDANLFGGNNDSVINSARCPKGSRSTRDYFNSCCDLLILTQRIAVQLLGEADCTNCDRVVEAVSHLLSCDDKALFPFFPVVLRLQLQKFTGVLCARPKALLLRIHEACSFLKTIIFFAFKENGSRSSLLSSPSSSSTTIPLPVLWTSMFEGRETMLHLLPDCELVKTLTEEGMEEKMKIRTIFLKQFVFAAIMDTPTKVCGEHAEKLSLALGVSDIVHDMPQLVLFDAAARGLSSNAELNCILNSVRSRHLAARIAAADFRIIVACCFKYYIHMKKSIPRGNRLELQRVALKLQSMDSAMSEECRLWIRNSLSEGGSDVVKRKQMEPSPSLPFEYRLVACPGWYTPQDLRAVEQKVWERLQQSRNSEGLLEFNALLLTLARAAAEGEHMLEGPVRQFAAELPTIAVSLGDLFSLKPLCENNGDKEKKTC